MSYRALLTGTLAAAVLAVGCAGGPPKPLEEMSRAKTLIEQAEQSGGQQYAAVEIQSARDKLQTAEQASGKGKNDVAQRLATEASLDAQLAVAKTSSGKSKASAAEVSESVETLRREASRNSGEQTQTP